ncbi:hypothetical protein [Thalassobellus citreus]|uniref:hypothetical protein n=1 Tax=Thalassobellus citreus TaxID=3367752 RepID=UPI0037A5D3C4
MTKKTKIIVLLVGFVLALLLCYQLAISKTVALKKEYHILKQQDLLFEASPKQVSLLKQKQEYYDGLLSKYQLHGSSVQNNLLKTINTFADSANLKVVSFLEPHTINKNELKISTYQFTIEGTYNAILKLIHTLEQDTKFGEITNLHFEKKTNFRTGKYYLQASVLLKRFG